MKGIRIFFRSISESMTNVGRNLSLSVASISCISITLVLVAVSIILSQNVNSFTTAIEKDVTIVTFIDREATNEEVEAIGIKIKSLDNIESVTFQSKNETKKQMQQDSEVFKSIMESYDDERKPAYAAKNSCNNRPFCFNSFSDARKQFVI